MGERAFHDPALIAESGAVLGACPDRRGFVRSWLPLKRPDMGAVDRRPGGVQGVRPAEFGEENLVEPRPHTGLGLLGQATPAGHTRTKPSSCCRYSQAIPVCRTNMMP
jgi:hypothetical protein